jgi:glycosyltransferase involved in cell wall biosynthesis
MRRICILTNFNYSRFLGECLESILSQTVPVERVIVIDDGSTDSSREVIERFANKAANLVPVFKENGGQLSCFNAAVPHVDQDDVAWLIDSDDIFPADYIEKSQELFRSKDVDCAFVKPVLFSKISDAPRTSRLSAEEHVYFPMTSAVTRVGYSWLEDTLSINQGVLRSSAWRLLERQKPGPWPPLPRGDNAGA